MEKTRIVRTKISIAEMMNQWYLFMDYLLRPGRHIRESDLTIISPMPNCKAYKLPFYTALRVVRKRNWYIAQWPKLSRFEHLKKFIFGDK